MSVEQFTTILPPAQQDLLGSQFESMLGFGLKDLSTLGDVAAFGAGESVPDLSVGAIVEAPDPAARDRLLQGLRRAIEREGEAAVGPVGVAGAEGYSIIAPDLPVPIVVAAQDSRVVVAGGHEAAEKLLSGEPAMADSETYATVKEGLGEEYSLAFMMEFGPLVQLLAESDAADDPDWDETKSYLDHIQYVGVGARRSEGRDETRFVIGVD